RKQRKTVRVEFDTEECLAATGDNVVGPRHLPHQLYSRIAEVSMAIVAQYVGIDVKDNFLTAIGKSPVPQRLRLGRLDHPEAVDAGCQSFIRQNFAIDHQCLRRMRPLNPWNALVPGILFSTDDR